MRQIGRRVAELQLALASRDDIADFAPEADHPATILTTGSRPRIAAGQSRARRNERAAGPSCEKRTRDDRQAPVLSRIAAWKDCIDLLPEAMEAMKIRHHGDFHLGQMLIVKDDVFIIDFEGEPRRSIAERRRKAPAARDVAGLIRSIDYSATAALERALQVGSRRAWQDRARRSTIGASVPSRRVLDCLPRRSWSIRGFGRRAIAGRRAASRFFPAGEGLL